MAYKVTGVIVVLMLFSLVAGMFIGEWIHAGEDLSDED